MRERRSTRGASVVSMIVLALAIPCAACSGDDPATARSPSLSEPESEPLGAGVALEVGGVPLFANEIEALADTLALVYPEQTRPALLRRVLVDVCLPRVALGIVHRSERERALAAAQNEVLVLRAGSSQNVPATLATPFAELDLPLQTALRGAAVGAVVGPIESSVGTFSVALVRTAFDEAASPLQEVVVDGWSFPYLDVTHESNLNSGQAALDGLGARFASETWRDLVPLAVRARLGVKQ